MSQSDSCGWRSSKALGMTGYPSKKWWRVAAEKRRRTSARGLFTGFKVAAEGGEARHFFCEGKNRSPDSRRERFSGTLPWSTVRSD